jgi:tetratricopeptide (TPR) repeat protein
VVVLVIALGLVAGAVAGVWIWRLQRPSASACEREVRTGDHRAAVGLCLQAYRDTGDERALYWAAKAHLYLGELEEADRLAHRLSASALDGDARGMLSYLALRQGRVREAQLQAILASAAHMAVGDRRGLATDEVSMSQAARRAGDFTAALSAADLALTLALQLRDSHIESVGYIARADALRRMGDIQGASDTLATAVEHATAPCDRTWTGLKRGLCLIDLGQDGLATAQLKAAARANEQCKSRDVSVQIASNQAWLLRKQDPAAAVAQLDDLARWDEEGADALLLRGYIAADRGALDDADRLLARAESLDPPFSDWPWEIACARAELFEQRGGPLGDALAEHHYQRSAAMVAALRAGTQARSAFLVSSHRGPYDGLISLLARNGRWRDALAVVLDLDASGMLRATANERVDHDRQAPEVDAPERSPVAAPPASVDAVLSAWRDRDLVIVLARSDRQIGPGSERVVRLQVSKGEVTGEDVGDAKAARTWADDLFKDPGDPVAARALGTMMVPPGTSDRTLYVLAIGSLGKVPLAALRDGDGSLIVRRRPLVRVLALRATRPESRGEGRPVVIADPRGDLPGAAAEGDTVARAVGSGVRVSGAKRERPATRAELWAGHDAALLHIAGHVVSHGRWRVLPMADGEVDPAEMLQHGLAPRIAVVASCGSAAATDEEGWGSIAAALLEAGTAVVVASDRRVDDAETLAMMRDFYAQPDWRTEPARALARVQGARVAGPAASANGAAAAQTWAAFSVLGRPPFIPATRP